MYDTHLGYSSGALNAVTSTEIVMGRKLEHPAFYATKLVLPVQALKVKVVGSEVISVVHKTTHMEVIKVVIISLHRDKRLRVVVWA